MHKLICAIFSSLQAITRRCGSVYLGRRFTTGSEVFLSVLEMCE